jgi:hypothetical protein
MKDRPKDPKHPSEGAPAEGRSATLGVRYDDMMARYANQVALRTTPEEVYLEFSSGVVQDPATGKPLMPVHTRIAMTHAGARRLAEILQQSLPRAQSGGNASPPGSPPLKS